MDLKKVQLNFVQSDGAKTKTDYENLVYWPASLTPCDPKFSFLGQNRLIAQSDLQYQSFNDVSGPNEEFNYFLAKISSDKKLICKPTKVFQMLPNHSFKDELASTDTTSNRLSKREQLDELKGKFGSKRSQRDLASKRKYEIQFGENDAGDLPTIKSGPENSANQNNNNDDDVDANIKNENVKKDDVGAAEQSVILPPRNLQAKHIKDVYSIDDIITEQERQSILEYEDQLFDSIQHDYVKELYQNQSSKSDDSQNRKVMAIYADLLHQLIKLPAWQMRKADPLPNVVGDIKKYIFERYTFSSQATARSLKYVLTDQKRDQAFVNICLLLFMLNDYKPIELDKFKTFYNAKMTYIRKIVELIGCHIENKRNLNNTISKVANLRLPLNVYRDTPKRLRR